MIVSQQANWLCLSIHCTVQPRYRLLLYVTVYIYDTQSQNLGRVCPSPFALYIHPVVQLHIYATSTSSTSSYTRAGHAIASSRSGHCVPRPTHQGLAFSTRCTTACSTMPPLADPASSPPPSSSIDPISSALASLASDTPYCASSLLCCALCRCSAAWRQQRQQTRPQRQKAAGLAVAVSLPLAHS